MTTTRPQALEWKRLYEDEGHTIETISLDSAVDPKTVRKWLHEVGTTMRKPGAGGGIPASKMRDGVKAKTVVGSGKVVKIGSVSSGRRRPHRRRYGGF